ncbi:hypothetical protein F5Y16DRAFT_375349 [Xylariaceae sp. FL0255]|nr:hypothetical protein F5Y16DRAFT_375349 [Xylariaceae sp. FL0255]
MAHLHLHHHDDSDEDDLQGSSTRWRHQESQAYARAARDANPTGNSRELSDFLNSSRVEPTNKPSAGTANGTKNYKAIIVDSADGAVESTIAGADGKEVICGPLLNYRHMEGNQWHGSALIVTQGGGKTQPFKPVLHLKRVDTSASEPTPEITNESSAPEGVQGTDIPGVRLYSDPRCTFWSFPLICGIEATETKWTYSISEVRYQSKTQSPTNHFFVPAMNESMRIMFHSCNGFSVGTDEEAWSGPALWNDVIRSHAKKPFHVMIGGGDQIYNDGIRVTGPLRQWTDIANPKKRRDFPFAESLRLACDEYYLRNYIRWYSTEPFAAANGQIPQLNIWDDHDIIDGFGSYVDDFMRCDVFRGIGGTAHKYYALFQHHIAPPATTYTSDPPKQMADGTMGYQEQTAETYVAPRIAMPPSYIMGNKPGPYVAEHSMSMFAKLGARIAFMGFDARTERTRHQVNYPETYDLVFNRVRSELGAAAEAGQPFKHLILLLGIPIAYPRLTWLENVFSSPLIAPIKFMNRRFGFGGGVFNHFDGSVDLLDDLDDHYTARTHKKERNAFVERLQTICADFSVRLTILGGDVHLAALGRFYSNPDLHIPAEEDHRYIVNVVSSAIVNKPPPNAIANLLASRNKIHHLNADTDETLMNLFDRDPGEMNKTSKSNRVTMPSRNYAVLTENSPNNTNEVASNGNGNNNGHGNGLGQPATTNGEPAPVESYNGKDGHGYLHAGESGAGTTHKAADIQTHGSGNDGSLDIAIRIEIDQHDKEGKTRAYGLTVPTLRYEDGKYGSHISRLGNVTGKLRSRSRPGTAVSTAQTRSLRRGSLGGGRGGGGDEVIPPVPRTAHGQPQVGGSGKEGEAMPEPVPVR